VRNNTFPEDPGSGTGGVTILQTDLTVGDIPQELRDLMTRDGAHNVSLSVTAVPAAPTLALLLSGLVAVAVVRSWQLRWGVAMPTREAATEVAPLSWTGHGFRTTRHRELLKYLLKIDRLCFDG
jgi:hypothetical protein